MIFSVKICNFWVIVNLPSFSILLISTLTRANRITTFLLRTRHFNILRFLNKLRQLCRIDSLQKAVDGTCTWWTKKLLLLRADVSYFDTTCLRSVTETNWTLVLWNVRTLIAIYASCHVRSLLLLLLWNCWWFHVCLCWRFSHWRCSLVDFFDAVYTLLLLETSCCKVTILLCMLRDKLLIVEVVGVGQLSLGYLLSWLLLLLLLLVTLEKWAHASLIACCGISLLHNACKLLSHHVWNVV